MWNGNEKKETHKYVCMLPWNKEIARSKVDRELNGEIPSKKRHLPHFKAKATEAWNGGSGAGAKAGDLVIEREI